MGQQGKRTSVTYIKLRNTNRCRGGGYRTAGSSNWAYANTNTHKHPNIQNHDRKQNQKQQGRNAQILPEMAHSSLNAAEAESKRQESRNY